MGVHCGIYEGSYNVSNTSYLNALDLIGHREKANMINTFNATSSPLT
jgi:hypothetical protein